LRLPLRSDVYSTTFDAQDGDILEFHTHSSSGLPDLRNLRNVLDDQPSGDDMRGFDEETRGRQLPYVMYVMGQSTITRVLWEGERKTVQAFPRWTDPNFRSGFNK
jgi:hypothetical protein